jgi:hypothetical protein
MKIMVIFILIVVNLSAAAQQFTVSADKMNILYKGWGSALSVTVSGVDCKNVILRADSQKIERSEEGSCRFYCIPTKKGYLPIKVFKKTANGEKLVGVSEFIVRDFPIPVAKLGGKRNDSMYRSILASQLGIVAMLQNCDCDAKVVVKHFTILIIRNQQTIFSKTMDSSRFDDEITENLKKLQGKDLVFVYDIIARDASGTDKSLDPIYIKVTE